MLELLQIFLRRLTRAALTADAPAAPAAGARGDGRARVVIEGITPQVDCGRYPVKRVAGETVRVEADVFADGHDVLVCMVRYRHDGDRESSEVRMKPLGNDRWRAEFATERLGTYRYTVAAWVDPLLTWQHDIARRVDAADIALAARIGARLVGEAAARAAGEPASQLRAWGERLAAAREPEEIKAIAGDAAMAALAVRHADRRLATTAEREFAVTVDRERARYSTWYELFPRSTAAEPGRHGTFRDCEARLPYIADMGFDVVYLPPIHPIGATYRKGRNNRLDATPDDVGSPWAIGGAEGGHKAVHPALGTLEDFRRLVASARSLGMEIALDIAFQVSPDHPYVREHPEWFTWRPDGTVQYAENPPKKYQDIYPFNFESEAWTALWEELRSVFEFWLAQGVRIFRVDNPHTKPFPFWECVIARLKSAHPDVILLSEAFTRPRVMHRLAKLGFTQSYTYFAWRNTKHEITEYFTELARGPGREYFRPNVWPNTPDILTEYLQHGGRPAFTARILLATTLAASYGIYGPAYELIEREPREPGSEEYLDSEKYQLRHWNLERPESLRSLIRRLNEIRRENPALQSDWSLAFHEVDNDQIIAYSKATQDRSNVIVAVVNLDPHHTHSGWLKLDAAALGLPADTPYQMHDLLTDVRYLWQGPRIFLRLEPGMAHVFRVRRRVRTEQDFDYFA
jgi:starch synthase (maltosyl-transferring)